jgi:hypothetical protein
MDKLRLDGKCWHDYPAKRPWQDFSHEFVPQRNSIKWKCVRDEQIVSKLPRAYFTTKNGLHHILEADKVNSGCAALFFPRCYQVQLALLCLYFTPRRQSREHVWSDAASKGPSTYTKVFASESTSDFMQIGRTSDSMSEIKIETSDSGSYSMLPGTRTVFAKFPEILYLANTLHANRIENRMWNRSCRRPLSE